MMGKKLTKMHFNKIRIIISNIFSFRKISKEEFVGTEKPKTKDLNVDAKAELAFKVFDKNHDGYITKSEMLKASKNLTKEQVSLFLKNSIERPKIRGQGVMALLKVPEGLKGPTKYPKAYKGPKGPIKVPRALQGS